MKIRIRDIVSGGLRIDHTVKAQEIDLVEEEFIDPDSALRVVADLQKVNNFVLAKIRVTFVAENHCARCLERLSRETKMDLEIDFEFDPGEEWLDLGSRVREELLMGVLPRALCREDCKGLCQGCGVDLNTEPCECKAPHKAGQDNKE